MVPNTVSEKYCHFDIRTVPGSGFAACRLHLLAFGEPSRTGAARERTRQPRPLGLPAGRQAPTKNSRTRRRDRTSTFGALLAEIPEIDASPTGPGAGRKRPAGWFTRASLFRPRGRGARQRSAGYRTYKSGYFSKVRLPCPGARLPTRSSGKARPRSAKKRSSPRGTRQ